jgi:hypothetical protein
LIEQLFESLLAAVDWKARRMLIVPLIALVAAIVIIVMIVGLIVARSIIIVRFESWSLDALLQIFLFVVDHVLLGTSELFDALPILGQLSDFRHHILVVRVLHDLDVDEGLSETKQSIDIILVLVSRQELLSQLPVFV